MDPVQKLEKRIAELNRHKSYFDRYDEENKRAKKAFRRDFKSVKKGEFWLYVKYLWGWQRYKWATANERSSYMEAILRGYEVSQINYGDQGFGLREGGIGFYYTMNSNRNRPPQNRSYMNYDKYSEVFFNKEMQRS